MNHNLGLFGENYTAQKLKNSGYQILERNYHSQYGEIDIIACNAQYIVFVEVKTRSERSIDSPFAAIGTVKQHKIIKTAQIYLAEHSSCRQPRFDAAAVVCSKQKKEQVISFSYIRSAFEV